MLFGHGSSAFVMTINPPFLTWQRRWIILIPFCLSMVVGMWLSMALPEVYLADALILMETEGRYVNESLIEKKMSHLEHQLNSRTHLERVMRETGLVSEPEYKEKFPKEKIVEMRRHLEVNVMPPLTGSGAVKISFKGRSPEKVTDVVRTLVAFFTDANAGESDSIRKDHFLQDELRAKAEELMAIENAIRAYRSKHIGGLPKQLASNLNRIADLRAQLKATQQHLRERKKRALELEGQMADVHQEMEAYVPDAPDAPAELVPESENALKLRRLKETYTRLTAKYTQRHPDVIRLKEKIAELEPEVAREKEIAASARYEAERAKNGSVWIVAGHQSEQANQIAELKWEYDAMQRDIKVLERETSGLSRKIRIYERRVRKMPERGEKIIALEQSYEHVQDAYQLLLKKKLDADVSARMKAKQGRLHFRVLDPPRIPRKPIWPDIKKMFLLSIVAGLGLGCGWLFLSEIFRRRHGIPSYHPKSGVMRVLNLLVSFISVLTALILLYLFAVIALKGRHDVISAAMDVKAMIRLFSDYTQ